MADNYLEKQYENYQARKQSTGLRKTPNKFPAKRIFIAGTSHAATHLADSLSMHRTHVCLSPAEQCSEQLSLCLKEWKDIDALVIVSEQSLSFYEHLMDRLLQHRMQQTIPIHDGRILLLYFAENREKFIRTYRELQHKREKDSQFGISLNAIVAKEFHHLSDMCELLLSSANSFHSGECFVID